MKASKLKKKMSPRFKIMILISGIIVLGIGGILYEYWIVRPEKRSDELMFSQQKMARIGKLNVDQMTARSYVIPTEEANIFFAIAPSPTATPSATPTLPWYRRLF